MCCNKELQNTLEGLKKHAQTQKHKTNFLQQGLQKSAAAVFQKPPNPSKFYCDQLFKFVHSTRVE